MTFLSVFCNTWKSSYNCYVSSEEAICLLETNLVAMVQNVSEIHTVVKVIEGFIDFTDHQELKMRASRLLYLCANLLVEHMLEKIEFDDIAERMETMAIEEECKDENIEDELDEVMKTFSTL
jgi:hypothetical protein